MPTATDTFTAQAGTHWGVFFDGLQQLVEHETTAPVRPPQDPADLLRTLSIGLGERGLSTEAVVEALVQIGKATPATASSQFFNQLFAGRIEAATMAEMFSAFLNNSMYTYKVAGPQILVERTLIDKMCGLAGFGAGEGTFTPGGSLSNMLAMIIAREERVPNMSDPGPSYRVPIAYTSDQAHYSVRKNAMLTGVGRKNLRKVASDSRGRMDPADFERQIEQDLANGHHPFFVTFTAGTTVLGAFDPIEELTAVARRHGLWVHVDGAMGGSMLLSKKHRPLLAGLADADSFTWDSHKLMGVPLTASVCLFREPGLLQKHLAEGADYLFQSDAPELDPGLASLQCGRRNDALKVWAAWKSYGDEGYAERIETMMSMAAYAASKVEQSPDLELTKEPESITVCFSARGVDAPSLCEALYEQGHAMVGYATVDGTPIVRLAVASPTTKEALDTFFASVEKVAQGLRSGRPTES